jgi:protein-tyrosine-phosphatase
MVIHFICRGNTHRSRLAEAYARSSTRDLADVAILSSGIEADRDLSGPIVPFVKRLLLEDDLLHFTGETWTQTTQSLIDDSDVLVFMSDDVYADALLLFQIPLERCDTWDIPDAQGVDGHIRSAVDTLLAQLHVV